MKFTPEIVQAFEKIISAAENENEMHSVGVLVDNLTVERKRNHRVLEKRICPVCGKEFAVTSCNRNQKTCSNSCRAKLYNPPKFPCGKEFAVTSCNRNQKTCSNSCRAKLYNPPKFPPKKRICPVCGKEFVVTSRNKKQKTCSNSCRAKWNWKKKLAASFNGNPAVNVVRDKQSS